MVGVFFYGDLPELPDSGGFRESRAQSPSLYRTGHNYRLFEFYTAMA